MPNPLIGDNRPTGRPKVKVTHRDVCRSVAKISAYLRCGDLEKARAYAYELVGYLIDLELLPPRNKE